MKKSEDCVNLRDCPIFWCTFSVRWRRPRPFCLVRSSKETTWPFWPEGNFLFWQELQCLKNYQNCLIYKNSNWRRLRRLVRGLRRWARFNRFWDFFWDFPTSVGYWWEGRWNGRRRVCNCKVDIIINMEMEWDWVSVQWTLLASRRWIQSGDLANNPIWRPKMRYAKGGAFLLLCSSRTKNMMYSMVMRGFWHPITLSLN